MKKQKNKKDIKINIKKEKLNNQLLFLDKIQKYNKILLCISIIFIIIYPIYNTLKLSYYSTIVVNSDDKEQTLKNYKITEAGSLKVLYDCNCTLLNWTINVTDENYIETLKHELCHLKQHLRVKNYDCINRKWVYFQELECYLAEELPNFIYEKLYYELKK